MDDIERRIRNDLSFLYENMILVFRNGSEVDELMDGVVHVVRAYGRQCAAAALEGLESDLLSAIEAIQEETKYRVWTALTRAQNDLVPLDPPPDAPQEDA